MKERAFWVAWSNIEGLGPTLIFRLNKFFGSLQTAWDADIVSLQQVEGIGEQTAQAIARQRSRLDPERLLIEHQQANPQFWTPADPDYPQLLLETPDPPPLLYYRGRVEPGENRGEVPAIAIVGTRHPSDYGRRWTRRISKALAQNGFTVVSGLAEGVDAEAHRSCLEVNGRTIAVIATGTNIVYPWTNRRLAQDISQQGLIVSEYPAGTKPDRVNFPRRNRIIAGLCRAVLVLEAPERSGALITARLATDYNRDVYALPGAVDHDPSKGCLKLICDGAQMILDEQHLLNLLGSIPVLTPASRSPSSASSTQALDLSEKLPLPVSPTPPVTMSLEPTLEKIFQAITVEPVTLDQIVEATQLPTGEVLGSLSQLELMGLVTLLPGNRYQRL